MVHRRALLTVPALLLPATVRAQHAGHGPKPAACDGALACAPVATPLIDPAGTLRLVWSAGGKVWAAAAAGVGAPLGPPVAITPEPAAIDDNGEARPKLVALRDGSLLAAWTIRRDQYYNGTLMLARSADGGRSFSAPTPLLAPGLSPSQRFEHLAEGPDGRVWLFWLDKRGVARPGQKPLPGAGLAMAVSQDGGRSFGPSRIVVETTCECCRLGLAFDAGGAPVLAWRHIFPGSERDHAVGRFTEASLDGRLHRVSTDAWAIEACPHHGPGLAIGADGTWHVTWWSGGGARRGLFHAYSTDAGANFSAPVALGEARHQPGHGRLLAMRDGLLLAWREFDGETTRIRLQRSADGRSWTAPEDVAATRDAADRPVLLQGGGRAYLSWQTAAEGWRLMPLPGAAT
jgi:hypothetical protein